MEAVKRISPRAEQLINEYGLGHIRGEYNEHWLKGGLIFAALLLAGLAMLALTLPTHLAPELNDGNWWQQIGSLSYFLIFLMGGSCFSLLGVIGVITLVITLWKGEKRLYLSDKGFVWARRRIETVVRWDAVAEIHKHILFMKEKSNNGQQVKSICSYTVISTEGKKCSFAAEPGPTIEGAVTAYQLPRTFENYASGKTLSFGWLALDSHGLHLTPDVVSTSYSTALAKLPGVTRMLQKLQGTCVESGEYFLPWEQLSCYWIDESHSTLILSRQGERKHWAIVPLHQIANPALCLALIEHVCYGYIREIAWFSEGAKSIAGQSVLVGTAPQAKYQLGPLVATYQTQSTRAGKLTVWGIGLFYFLLIGGFVGLCLLDINNPLFSPFFFVATIGVPIVTFVLMFFGLWWQFRVHISFATPIRRKIVVSLYERGFVYCEGRKSQAVTWEQVRFVERLTLPRKKMPRRYYKLTLKDAAEITLPIVIAQIQELGAAIEREMTKRLLPDVLADYDAHKPVVFTGFCLNQDSVSKSDESLPWSQVEQVSLAKEELAIKERRIAKDWFSIPAVQVRNMCVLEALLVRIREDHGFSMNDSPVMIKG